MTEENKNDSKNKFKLIMIITVIAVIIVIGIIIYCFVSQNNASSQIKDLKNNINKNNYTELAKQLSTNQRNMKPTEAKHLINYFNDDGNKKRLYKELNEIQKNLDNKNSLSDLGEITDRSGSPIIKFSKNGKRYFFLDKISMEPKYRKVYVKELNNDATYNFDKKHQVAVQKNKLNEIGSFVVGDYEIPVKKEFNSGPVQGSINGYLQINSSEKQDKKHIIAKQDFNQTKIKIKIKKDSKLKEKRLYINNELINLKENKEYGYFPNDNAFEVKASGKIHDDVFKTNTVSVTKGIDENTQIVNLEFNDKEINKKIKANKKNEKEISQFIKNYMKHLNEAYKKTDYKPIKSDIKSGSEAERFMKPKFNSKQDIKYKSTKILDIQKQDDKYKVNVSKKYKTNLVKTVYYVEKKDDSFKISKMQDKT